MKTDIYSNITNKIITQLEQGTRPWLRPWKDGAVPVHPRRSNGEKYRGINVITLWFAAETKGYTTPYWMTFKQALDFGGHVRKGETGEKVVYASSFKKTETDKAGNEKEKNIPFLKEYTVFNAAQCEGLPERFYPKAPVFNPVEKLDHAERFFAATGALIRNGGDRAFYAPGPDVICMPAIEQFTSREAYYATLAHECIHWTSHKSRLNRDFGSTGFASEGYAKEELVAEIGAAFIAADLGLYMEPREDHAAYIASWLKALKDDKRLIVSAASHATKAADYLNAFSNVASVAEAA